MAILATTNSKAGIEAWDNRLEDQYSLAVSRDVEAAFRAAGIAPLDAVEVYLKNGETVTLAWEDRTSAEYRRETAHRAF